MEQISLTLALIKQGFSLLSENCLFFMNMTCHIFLIALWFLIMTEMWMQYRTCNSFLWPMFSFAAFKQNKGAWGEFLQYSCFLNCLRTASSRSDVRVQSFLFSRMGYCLWVGWECNNVPFPVLKPKNWSLTFVVSPRQFTKSTFRLTLWQYPDFLLKKSW